MTTKRPFGLPPERSSADKIGDPAAAERFIQGGSAAAANAPVAEPAAPPAPTAAAVPKPQSMGDTLKDLDDERRQEPYNTRFTMREKYCLAFIAKKTPFSQQGFIIDALRPALVAKMKELTGEDVSAWLQTGEED